MKKLLLTLTVVCSVLLIAGCMKKPTTNDIVTNDVATGAQETGTVVAPQDETAKNDDAKKGSDLKIANDQKALWEGKKLWWAHNGTVDLLPESIITIDSNGNILDGKVVVAMNTIVSLDSTGDMGDKLNTHLKSADFFDTANHPTSVIDTISVSWSNITANVTIRGVTKEMTFPVVLTADGDGYLMSAELNIVRKDFGIADTLLGKVALEDTFMIKLDKVTFMR